MWSMSCSLAVFSLLSVLANARVLDAGKMSSFGRFHLLLVKWEMSGTGRGFSVQGGNLIRGNVRCQVTTSRSM